MKKRAPGTIPKLLLQYLDTEKWATTNELAAVTELPANSVAKALAKMRRDGYAVSERYPGGGGQMRHKLDARPVRRGNGASKPEEVATVDLVKRIAGDLQTLMDRLDGDVQKARKYDKLVERLGAAGININVEVGDG